MSLQLPGPGFTIDTVTVKGKQVPFSLDENKITLQFDQPTNLKAGERIQVLVA